MTRYEIDPKSVKDFYPNPIGCLRHDPTTISIMVYKKMNWFHKLMIRICFGLNYIDYDKNK